MLGLPLESIKFHAITLSLSQSLPRSSGGFSSILASGGGNRLVPGGLVGGRKTRRERVVYSIQEGNRTPVSKATPVSDRTRMKSRPHIPHVIALAIHHNFPSQTNVAQSALSSLQHRTAYFVLRVPLGLSLCSLLFQCSEQTIKVSSTNCSNAQMLVLVNGDHVAR